GRDGGAPLQSVRVKPGSVARHADGIRSRASREGGPQHQGETGGVSCWYMKMNLVELRTMPQGHPDYRFICQEMWRKIQEVHPALAEAGKFIDWQQYRLGRLQS